MKKLRRAPEKFGVLELFADMATEHGYMRMNEIKDESGVLWSRVGLRHAGN